MSQYFVTKPDSERQIMYGLDKPTGGYFFTEFYTDDEIEDEFLDTEVANSQDGLTLSELRNVLKSEYNFVIDITAKAVLVEDWMVEDNPTNLQYHVANMFGKDLPAMLKRVGEDVAKTGLN